MQATLTFLDWAILASYTIFAIALGAYYTKEAGRSTQSFFVGDRKLPWWIAGTSIVATTFAADTPLAITGIVASDGIAGNWIWWCGGIAHAIATFWFAKLWKRSGVITDAEITELRYSGKPAAALRGFKAIYYGLFINCLTMAWVITAMNKICQVFFDIPANYVIATCVTISVLYTTLGGFRSVVITDMVQFAMGMIGALVLAIYALDQFSSIGPVSESGSLLYALNDITTQKGKELAHLINFVPDQDNPKAPYFLALVLVGWWRLAEGNGYIVQRLAACKDEQHAQKASLWFAIAHNALRPWPWILVALAALVLFPESTVSDRESTYPLMMAKLLPSGMLGLVLASLLAAFMSTIDTHTNWGASYLVRDLYQRFIRPNESPKHYVMVSRICIVLMGIIAGISATFINNIGEVWVFLVILGAGLGSVSAARWYWSRVTAWAEFAALGISTILAIALLIFCSTTLFGNDNPWFIVEITKWQQIYIIAAASLGCWIPVALFGPQEKESTLQNFAHKVAPGGPGWKRFNTVSTSSSNSIASQIVGTLSALWMIFATLFGIGQLLFASTLLGVLLLSSVPALLLFSPVFTKPTKHEQP